MRIPDDHAPVINLFKDLKIGLIDFIFGTDKYFQNSSENGEC